MKIFFDTEFIDTGSVVDLISIGLVREDGAEYYAEAAECDKSRACEWVRKNVFPHLRGDTKPRKQIAEEVEIFCGPEPEFWAYFASYDWLCLCQLYGRMMDAPWHWPKFVNDLQSIRSLRGIKSQPDQGGSEHNALEDARWNLRFYRYMAGLV